MDQFFSIHRWSSETCNKYRWVLERFTGDIDDTDRLTLAGLSQWLRSQGWGSSTQYYALYAVKHWLKYKHGSAHPALDLTLRRPKTFPRLRVLTFEKARKLLAHFDTSTPKGRRDIAMCALFLDSGLRVSEIARLELKYIYLDERLLTVIVKGGDWGTAGYSPRTKQYLIDWLEVRSGIAKRSITAFFVGIGGTTPGEKMTRDGIKVIVKKWGIDSGIGALSPHDFRRSFATLGTLLGGPQRVMMIGGRWKDQTTFERYIQEITIKDLDPYYPVPAIIGRV